MYKRVKQKMFWVISWVMAIIGALAVAGGYLVVEKICDLNNGGNTDQMSEMISGWLAILDQGNSCYWAFPIVFVFFILLGILLWAALTASMRGVLEEEKTEGDGRKGQPKKKDFIDQKIERERRQRLFLHSLSILQREGRLIDFFDEDLSRYEDAQIGAAVRSIQEDCKKAVKSTLIPGRCLREKKAIPLP